ncbi:thylakoid membrane photosystem I accumulation factor [Okeania sp. SIO2G5]|uniref:thylakoid membrane photosystem I accumulation factor n=1 Tax=Okeania sp. SIO2G5 TaxID=2607796 RepID=UPI0013BFEBE0|nr:thylakoid membrane photosystem I accumulation factor [Okeania sp. SIO2G5]NEP76214.1 thioredoxin family protein [Okeania sp. SIO2G5]
MVYIAFRNQLSRLKCLFGWQQNVRLNLFVSVMVCLLTVLLVMPTPAWASLNDDRYDGNIFPLYAGNGSLVPPRMTLKEALNRSDRPTVLGLYVDDSEDCKKYSTVWSTVDAYYGRAAYLIFLSVDSIPPQDTYAPDEAGYYYKGAIPQTTIIDTDGTVVFSETGNVPYETLDDTLREVFDLLPRSESEELKRRSFNEQNFELVPSN